MKEGIHPKYGETTVTCGCGETFMTRSTKKEIRVEICSKCHPFYTGQQKLVDSAGRVERFIKRYGWRVQTAEPASKPAEPEGKPDQPVEETAPPPSEASAELDTEAEAPAPTEKKSEPPAQEASTQES